MAPISRAQARVLRQLKTIRDAEDAEARLAAKTDAFVDNFIHSTPQQVVDYIENNPNSPDYQNIEDYINTNVTDLASAKTILKRMGRQLASQENVLKKMSLMLLLLARKEYLE